MKEDVLLRRVYLWLCGHPFNHGHKQYIFPHGLTVIRKELAELYDE